MLRRYLPALLGVLLIVSFSAGRVFAGDLQVKFDKEGNTFALTNTLTTTVYVLYLEGAEENIPVHARIDAGKIAIIPLHDMSLPPKLEGAACTFMGEPPAGYNRGEDGKFHLSVDPA
jgi:hypothetical protein